jgi:cellulose synthase/poly-beta-1,6-N-acetylglucosamine synthase-like glycosyltransferase
MKVLQQPNGGKHRAHNLAVTVAEGELMIILDSDDELAPGALACLWSEWTSVPEVDRGRFAGVIGHSIDDSNQLVGLQYPSNRVDGYLFELIMSGIMAGGKLPCYRTDILRLFPFPERAGCNALVPEV